MPLIPRWEDSVQIFSGRWKDDRGQIYSLIRNKCNQTNDLTSCKWETLAPLSTQISVNQYNSRPRSEKRNEIGSVCLFLSTPTFELPDALTFDLGSFHV